MLKVLLLGSSGMLGSSFRKLSTNFPNIELITVSRGKDNPNFRIASLEQIPALMQEIKPTFTVNCIGIIKPHIRIDDPASIKMTFEANSCLPFSLAAESSKYGGKVIQIATDCVFDGKLGFYDEDFKHNANDLYGKSKSMGEPIYEHFLNLRCSIIGFETYSKNSLLNWFLSHEPNSVVPGFTNHFWNGVTTDVFAEIVYGLILSDKWVSGAYHLVPADSVSKFELLNFFRSHFSRFDISIQPQESVESINRTLKTKHKNMNQFFWKNSRFGNNIPSIENLVSTL